MRTIECFDRGQHSIAERISSGRSWRKQRLQLGAGIDHSLVAHLKLAAISL